MRTIQIKIIFILSLGVFFLSRCNDPSDTPCIYNDERLCDPAYRDSINQGGDGVDTIAFNADLSTYDEKILLEEFTGFRCTNCPEATAQATELKDMYPDRLYLSSIHCMEIFAAPLPPGDDPNGEFQIDMRTTEGNIWFDYYMPLGLPNGLINRLGTEFSTTISSFFWTDRIADLIGENNPQVYIKITEVEVDSSASVVKVHATVKPLILSEDDAYYINAWILENGIIAGQKSRDGVLHNYEHNHVFRSASNGPWGALAYNGASNLDANTALDFQMSIPIESDWVIENCHILVVISKESTREIIQVEEKEVIE